MLLDIQNTDLFFTVVISVGVQLYHRSSMDDDQSIEEDDNSSEASIEEGVHSERMADGGLGRPVRAKVIYSSQMEENDEAARRRAIRAEQEAKKKAEEEEFEAFKKKKKYTMKDIPDFTGISLGSEDTGLSGFI